MASIHREIRLDADPADVWAAISAIGAPHERLVPGVLVDTQMDGDARVVTFANGLVVRELIVTLDHDARRFVYASVGGRATHHNASFQVFADGAQRTRLVWITDVLPDELAGPIGQNVELGIAAIKQTLERKPGAS
ncbi:SRPBCC family protein [Rhodanobacter sp. DHG33]|uniref:SRPBCC family protein n=1 Tax=Rhodanobacter sp. DHG33 TaxID=2775921 RepID=UPI0017866A71|nr:SRPBCC family protein [Rhodanobacter sp. DHG33]MBD8899029.1 SRPBCC family protein [Rhodanobacter sp. DHG33]